MSSSNFWWAWALLIVCEIFFVLMLMSPESIKESRVEERALVGEMFGSQYANQKAREANAQFRAWFIESGAKEKVRDVLVPRNKDKTELKEFGGKLFGWVDKRLDSVWQIIEYSTFRWFVIVSLFPFVLPILLPAIVDAAMKREVRKACFGYASPTMYHFGKALMFSALLYPLVVLLFPFTLSPWVIVLWFGLLPFVTWMAISNVQNMV